MTMLGVVGMEGREGGWGEMVLSLDTLSLALVGFRGGP